MLTVVAALIEHEGKVLACQRRRGERFELKWEFPGGKVKAGETLEAALSRELKEELGVASRIGPELYRTQHHYAEMQEPVELVFFSARVNAHELRNLNFEEIQWCTPASLPELDFLAADRELIEKLSSGELRLSRNESS
jgi:8-oxo-dGTP diphosphatase